MYFHTKSGKKLVSIMAAMAAFIVIGGASSSFAVSAASINPGSSGTQVVELQTKLKQLGYFDANCTGYYGNITKTAVADFQSDNGFKATGAVDNNTYNALFEIGSFSGKGTVNASYLNARSGPGTNYAVVGGFGKGASVTIIDKKNSWYKVKISNSKSGWVSSDYITLNKSNTSSSTNTGNSSGTTGSNNSVSNNKKIVITASTLNARVTASTAGAILGTVNRNEVYTYISAKNGWYLITLANGRDAYICGDYVKAFTSYPIKGGGSYIWPLQTSKKITSYFGETEDRNHTHKGLDVAAAGGSQIIAAASGKVVNKAYEGNGFGHYIVIEQNDGVKAYYAHMKQASYLSIGDTVKAGQTIGMVGSTGRSTGNHLHLEFRKGSTKIDPLNYYPNIK